jgi:hypothetical protein
LVPHWSQKVYPGKFSVAPHPSQTGTCRGLNGAAGWGGCCPP